MKNLNFLTKLTWAALIMLAALNFESCSSKKATVSCPDLHGSAQHHLMAMHWKTHNSNHQSASVTPATKGSESVKTAADAPKVQPMGIASLSNEVPKTPMGIYEVLTSDERAQVKQQISSLLVKKPFSKILGKMVNKKFENLDKKYPAPAQSVLKENSGGGLSTGEILAIVAAACCLTWVLGIAGMIIGIIALQKIKKDGGAQWAKILAIVAIALGALEFLTFLIWLIFAVIVIGTV